MLMLFLSRRASSGLLIQVLNQVLINIYKALHRTGSNCFQHYPSPLYLSPLQNRQNCCAPIPSIRKCHIADLWVVPSLSQCLENNIYSEIWMAPIQLAFCEVWRLKAFIVITKSVTLTRLVIDIHWVVVVRNKCLTVMITQCKLLLFLYLCLISLCNMKSYGLFADITLTGSYAYSAVSLSLFEYFLNHCPFYYLR